MMQLVCQSPTRQNLKTRPNDGAKHGAKVSMFGAKVSGANLSGAKVSMFGAKVSGAKVSGAKVSGAEPFETFCSFRSKLPLASYVSFVMLSPNDRAED